MLSPSGAGKVQARVAVLPLAGSTETHRLDVMSAEGGGAGYFLSGVSWRKRCGILRK